MKNKFKHGDRLVCYISPHYREKGITQHSLVGSSGGGCGWSFGKKFTVDSITKGWEEIDGRRVETYIYWTTEFPNGVYEGWLMLSSKNWTSILNQDTLTPDERGK